MADQLDAMIAEALDSLGLVPEMPPAPQNAMQAAPPQRAPSAADQFVENYIYPVMPRPIQNALRMTPEQMRDWSERQQTKILDPRLNPGAFATATALKLAEGPINAFHAFRNAMQQGPDQTPLSDSDPMPRHDATTAAAAEMALVPTGGSFARNAMLAARAPAVRAERAAQREKQFFDLMDQRNREFFDSYDRMLDARQFQRNMQRRQEELALPALPPPDRPPEQAFVLHDGRVVTRPENVRVVDPAAYAGVEANSSTLARYRQEQANQALDMRRVNNDRAEQGQQIARDAQIDDELAEAVTATMSNQPQLLPEVMRFYAIERGIPLIEAIRRLEARGVRISSYRLDEVQPRARGGQFNPLGRSQNEFAAALRQFNLERSQRQLPPPRSSDDPTQPTAPTKPDADSATNNTQNIPPQSPDSPQETGRGSSSGGARGRKRGSQENQGSRSKPFTDVHRVAIRQRIADQDGRITDAQLQAMAPDVDVKKLRAYARQQQRTRQELGAESYRRAIPYLASATGAAVVTDVFEDDGF